MTIKKLSPDKVRITLSHEELAAYEIDWDHLGPDDEPTRELLLQLGNPDALVLVAEDTAVKVKDLLPFYWQEE